MMRKTQIAQEVNFHPIFKVFVNSIFPPYLCIPKIRGNSYAYH